MGSTRLQSARESAPFFVEAARPRCVQLLDGSKQASEVLSS